MARPYKQNLSFFPMSISEFYRTEFTRLARKHHIGYLIAIYISLKMEIYDNGYFLETKDLDQIEYKIKGRLNGEGSPSYKLINTILKDIFISDIYDVDLITKGYITSREIQENFYRATARRKSVEIIKDIWLLDAEDMKKIRSTSHILNEFEPPKIENKEKERKSRRQKKQISDGMFTHNYIKEQREKLNKGFRDISTINNEEVDI